ncbi:MAG: hypothetical protein KGY75_06190 [Candidatus Cloacimonetes bacterium]|nr:hypothetical protein [Candidatus Cloacimonadota bacterium]MBS3767689.1 hypothetical protein [Candidatus Cloacimonadota bacterium]
MDIMNKNSEKLSEINKDKKKQPNYYITVFDFVRDYDVDRKEKIVKDTFKRLNKHYFPNNSLPVFENILLIKEKIKGKIDMHIENEIMLNGEKTAQVEFDSVEINYLILPVEFEDIKKYLINKYSDYVIDYLKNY